MHLQLRRRVARPDALVGEPLAAPHAADVAHERRDDPHQLARARPVRALHDLLGRREDSADVASPPRVGEREDRGLGAAGGHLLDVAQRDLFAGRPGGELVDLALQLVEVVADHLDERPARVGVGLRAVAAELLGDPLGQLALRHVVGEHLAAPSRPPSRARSRP